jgi:hypothetical protein
MLEQDQISIFFDDICIPANSQEEICEKFTRFLQVARESRLKFDAPKTKICFERINYLGFEISESGVRPQKEKVAKLQNMPRPAGIREVRRYLGFVNYYGHMIPNLAHHAAPLFNLLRKENKTFIWTQECQDSFDYLKRCLCEYPVLCYADPLMEKHIFVDASTTNIGGIICQKYGETFRPISYASKRLNLSLKRQTIFSLEAFAVYYCLKTFAKYLVDRKAMIYTDCMAVSYLMRQQKLQPHLARYILYISTFNITLKHIPGKENPSDFLSRIICSLAEEQPWDKNQITPFFSYEILRKFQTKDQSVILIKEKLQEYPELSTRYFVEDGLLYRRKKDFPGSVDTIFAPLVLQNELVRAYHESLITGHQGIERTKQIIAQNFYWPGMHKTCENFVRACRLCNYRKRGAHKKLYSIEGIERCSGPGHTLSADVCGPLACTEKGNIYSFNMVDMFSKSIYTYPIPDQKADTLAHVIFTHICNHGSFQRLILDNFKSHKSAIFQGLCKLMNVQYIYTTFYSKKGTGNIERANRKIWDILAILQKSLPMTDWDNLTPLITASLNAMPCASVGYPPYFLERGRLFRLPWVPILTQGRLFYNEDDYVQKQKNYMKKVFEAAAEVNKRETERFVTARNKKASDEKFHVHQLIYIYFPQLVKYSGLKDSLPYCGPYMIICIKRDKTVYARSLMTNNVVKCHIERCKKYYGNQIFERKPDEFFHSGAEKVINHETQESGVSSDLPTLKSIKSTLNSTREQNVQGSSSDSEESLCDVPVRIDEISHAGTKIQRAIESDNESTNEEEGLEENEINLPTEQQNAPPIIQNQAQRDKLRLEGNDTNDGSLANNNVSNAESEFMGDAERDTIYESANSEVCDDEEELTMLDLIQPNQAETGGRALRDRNKLKQPDRYTP